MFRLIVEKFHDPAAGQEAVVLVSNVYDPTGGLGTIPREFNDGFCETLHHPFLTPAGRMDALGNLDYFNSRIETVAAENGGVNVDYHALFIDHGMNAAGGARWIDSDCAHPNAEGHHQQRRLYYQVVTGDSF
jgi:hypothetical protein